MVDMVFLRNQLTNIPKKSILTLEICKHSSLILAIPILLLHDYSEYIILYYNVFMDLFELKNLPYSKKVHTYLLS